MKQSQLDYYQELTKLIKPTYVITLEQFKALKESKKYKIIKMWITPLSHKCYEGRQKNKRDYFQGYRVETEKVDLIYLSEIATDVIKNCGNIK